MDFLVAIGNVTTPAESMISTLSSSFTTIAGNLTTVLTTIAPVALSVLGAGIVLKYGIRWFKRITDKG